MQNYGLIFSLLRRTGVKYTSITCTQTFHPKKVYIGSGSRVGAKTQSKSGSEFNSIHFGIEISKRLKFLRPILNPKFLGLKNVKKNIRKFFKNFQKSQKFLEPNIFGCQKF